MAEGNTLFLMGGTNGIVEADDNADQFGLMPFLSEDGTQNVFVLNVNRFYGPVSYTHLDVYKRQV